MPSRLASGAWMSRVSWASAGAAPSAAVRRRRASAPVAGPAGSAPRAGRARWPAAGGAGPRCCRPRACSACRAQTCAAACWPSSRPAMPGCLSSAASARAAAPGTPNSRAAAMHIAFGRQPRQHLQRVDQHAATIRHARIGARPLPRHRRAPRATPAAAPRLNGIAARSAAHGDGQGGGPRRRFSRKSDYTSGLAPRGTTMKSLRIPFALPDAGLAPMAWSRSPRRMTANVRAADERR